MRCVNLVQTTCMHDASTNGHDDHMHDGPPRKLVSIMFIVFFPANSWVQRRLCLGGISLNKLGLTQEALIGSFLS